MTPSLEQLRDAFAAVPAAVSVLAVEHAGRVHATTISSFQGVSFEPPIAVVMLHRDSSILPRIVSVRRFAVNQLSEAQEALARMCASPNRQPLDGRLLEPGTPFVSGASARFLLNLRERTWMGDHLLLFADIVHVEASPRRPLLYQRRKYWSLGLTG
jgi:flavin reductase